MFGWLWKSEGIEKVSLCKFCHIPLLKNDGQLKQKSDQKKLPNLLKKNQVKKKSCLVKQRKKKNKK